MERSSGDEIPPAVLLAPVPDPQWRRAWIEGSQFVYAATAEQRLVLGKQPPGAPPSVRLGITGELSFAVVGTGRDTVDLQVHVLARRLEFESEGKSSLDERSRPQMLEHLQTPFFVTLNMQGAALSTYFEIGINPVAQNFLRSLVAATQFVMPDARQDAWEAQELDVTGQYVARYSGMQGASYVKSKARYLRVASPGGLRPVDPSVSVATQSRTLIVLGKEFWPTSLEGHERVEIDSKEGAPPIIGEGEVSLSRIAVRHAPALIGTLEARRKYLGHTSLATAVFVPVDPRDELRRQVAGATLGELATTLRGLSKNGTPDGERTAQVMGRLKALFLLEPGTAASVPGLLSGEKDRNTYSTMLGALSAASTPEAVRALSQVASDVSHATVVRVDAIAALGVVENPTQEGVAALRGVAASPDAELRGTATLALGNATRNALRGDPALGEGMLAELMRSATGPSSPEARALLIRSLANTADARVLPTLQQALQDPSPVVREAAAEALRLIPGPDVDRLVSRVMLEDLAPEVRRAAIFASSFRALAPQIPALAQVIRHDTVEAVRIEAVRLLGANLRQAPGVAELLAWAGQNDPNSDVRHTAQAFLSARPPVQ